MLWLQCTSSCTFAAVCSDRHVRTLARVSLQAGTNCIPSEPFWHHGDGRAWIWTNTRSYNRKDEDGQTHCQQA